MAEYDKSYNIMVSNFKLVCIVREQIYRPIKGKILRYDWMAESTENFNNAKLYTRNNVSECKGHKYTSLLYNLDNTSPIIKELLYGFLSQNF